MKARIVVQPSGLINGQPWPEVGEEIDLPKAAIDSMAEAGWVEAVVEKRPAPKGKEEKRG